MSNTCRRPGAKSYCLSTSTAFLLYGQPPLTNTVTLPSSILLCRKLSAMLLFRGEQERCPAPARSQAGGTAAISARGIYELDSAFLPGNSSPGGRKLFTSPRVLRQRYFCFLPAFTGNPDCQTSPFVLPCRMKAGRQGAGGRHVGARAAVRAWQERLANRRAGRG